MLPQLKSRSFFSLHGKVPANRRTEVLKNFVATESGILCTTDLAARGLDFDQHPIHWIVQYDAPQDPAFFIHRVGRAARMGQMGSAVLFLTKAELTYIDFLNVRKVPIISMDIPSNYQDVLPTIKAWIRKDRDLVDKGKLAFVSWIRAYKEHHCNYIFLLKNLDFGGLLNGFPLLEAPKMPELQGISLLGFLAEDTTNIPYTDKKREAKRQATLKQDFNKKKTKEKLKDIKKKKWEARAQEQPEQMEEDDIDKDYALLKKLKKKKITEEEFEAEVEADLELVPSKPTKRHRPDQAEKQNPAKKQKVGGKPAEQKNRTKKK